MKYIEITQDGVGRIVYDKTPKEFVGLCTNSLDTCAAIVFIAESGITLIHDTGKLAIDGILKEYKGLTNVQSWAVVFNAKKKSDALENISRFKDQLFKLCKNFQAYGCDGHVTVSCEKGKINVRVNEYPAPNELLEPKHKDKRHRANILNNLFLNDDEEMICDLQYDGMEQTDPPPLAKTALAMYEMLQRPKFTKWYEGCFGNLLAYLLMYKPEEYGLVSDRCEKNSRDAKLLNEVRCSIKKERMLLLLYKAKDMGQAFRKAAGFGHMQHLALMYDADPSIINAVGPKTRKSALHVAVSESKLDNVMFLLAKGIDTSLRDEFGKTAREYVSSDNLELQGVFAKAGATISNTELLIDLHSFSVEKAKFLILNSLAHASNISKIRVITGRGNHANSTGERGVLYNNFRSWLSESSYQNRIDKIFTGDGYYEIYLRETSPHPGIPQIANELFSNIYSDIDSIRIKADQGDIVAKFIVAVHLASLAKNEKDLQVAFSYLLQAAEGGYGDAMISLARDYMIGRGIRQNNGEAIKWLQKALLLEQWEAALMLGDCYWQGCGVTQDPYQAVTFYRQGAEHNNPLAMRKLASAYKTGVGSETNLKEAFAWYKKAAELGEVTSQYNIAVMYEHGYGDGLILPDTHKAYDYYLRAAHGGDPEAQYKVGSFYLAGEVVAQDQKQAHEWLRLAARNGSALAAAKLKEICDGDLEVLELSAQAGNLLDSVAMKVQKCGGTVTAERRDQLFLESYIELRDLPVNNITHLEHQSKFFLIDNLLIDKNKRYAQKAIEVLQDMAQEQCIFSLRHLAHAYHNGVGVKKDEREAIACLEQAYKLQDGKSTKALADLYELGMLGQAPNHQKAQQYYKEAAAFGYPPASYHLGLVCCDNHDAVNGMMYLQKAIELEKDEAQCRELFSSGFIDTYKPIKADAAYRLSMEYFSRGRDAANIQAGLQYMQLAQEWGNLQAKKFLDEARQAGALKGLSEAWGENEVAEDAKSSLGKSY